MGGRQSRCCCCCCYLLHIRAPHQSHTCAACLLLTAVFVSIRHAVHRQILCDRRTSLVGAWCWARLAPPHFTHVVGAATPSYRRLCRRHLGARSHGAGSCRNGGARSCRYRDAADGPIEGVFDFVALGVRPVDAASVTRGVGCAGIRRWYGMDSKQRGEEGCRGVCRSSCHRVVVPWVEVSRTKRDVSSTLRWLMLMLTTVPRRGNKHWHAGGRSGEAGRRLRFVRE